MARRLSDQFQQHKSALDALQKRKREDVQLCSIVHDSRERRTTTTYGKKQPGDVYRGDIALRDLKNILIAFDQNGCALPPPPSLCRLQSHSALSRTQTSAPRTRYNFMTASFALPPASSTRPTGARLSLR